MDDGSSDNTAQEAARADARVITLQDNQGKGVALRTGILASSGRWLVFLDADGQDDPAEIPVLLNAANDNVSMVNGSRFMGHMEKGAISRPNWFGNLMITGIFDLCFGTRITDTQAGFRVIDGRLARALPLVSQEYEIETEMLAKVLRRGLKVIEIPVNRYQRAAGTTDFRRIRNGLRILRTIFRERVRRP